MNHSEPQVEPTRIGQYEVTGRIGRGSFGVVYRGRDPYLKRDVAIKVCMVEDEHLRQRFYREAEIAGKLEHDHVVAVHAFGFEDGAPYLVQEFLEGEDLSNLINQRVAWSGRRKLDVLAQIASALAYAHSQQVIHRDVKPANVRVLTVDPAVKVKLMDFGIAKLAHDESQLTQKGVTMGTASYLPPEQVKGGAVDHRGDIFSFGVLAYELLTLGRPFRGQTLSALVYQILYKAPAKLEDTWSGCPPELSRWVHRCLQKDPSARFNDFDEVLAELETLRQGAADGRWPILSDVWLPAGTASTESGASGSASGSASVVVASTDESIEPPAGFASDDEASVPATLEGSVGGTTRILDSGSARPDASADSDATQPVPVTPPPPEGAVEASEDSGAEIPEELRTSAHEIQRLVEAGELDSAMQQLEQTIHRQKGMVTSDGITGVLPKPTASPPGKGKLAVQIDAERPTVEIPLPVTTAARAAAPPPLPDIGATTPVPRDDRETQSRLPDPELSRTRTTGTDAPATGSVDTSTTGTSASGTSSTGTGSTGTVGLPLRGAKGKWVLIGGAFAVAAVLAVIMGWSLGRGRSSEPEPTLLDPAVPPAPEAPVEPPNTGLVVQATPWAFVSEVTNADGYVVDLPEDAATPLYLPLEPGSYTVIVRHSESNGEQRCEVQVTAESSAMCITPFTQPTASDYFKDAGWWR